MTQEEMLRLVPETLRKIEKEYGVKVLYAAESGSRAWGFASPDSDFDVRFVYCRPEDSYLLLDQPRDVIELPIDDTWDVSGWDLQKALRLLARSNPSLFEWFQSPICYWDHGFGCRFQPLLDQYYDRSRMLLHYGSMAENNWKALQKSERVKPKSYYYILRPLLACRWVLAHREAPPVPFETLRSAMLPDGLGTELDTLLEIKRNAPEGMLIPHVPPLDAFIIEELSALQQNREKLPPSIFPGWEPLDQFFREELQK